LEAVDLATESVSTSIFTPTINIRNHTTVSLYFPPKACLDFFEFSELILKHSSNVGDIYYECERFNSLDRCNEAIKIFDEALTDLAKVRPLFFLLLSMTLIRPLVEGRDLVA
jgi:hypothetical protein